ncbi:MAG: NAD-dependent succinate-semialdehyde dehydrogenase [Bacteroidetes bacterium]|nr:NAD-dependent succinate-semialdehyde dehydrogenase [Bacteroidota bacterium]
MKSINPTTNHVIREYPEHSSSEVRKIIEDVHSEWLTWKETTFEYRSGLLKSAARILRQRKETYARMMTEEMGKIIRESMAEIEKCAVTCDYYAENGAEILQDRIVVSDASRSLVVFQPLGVILAVMPWNFPFWQVIRFAAPAIMAGNAAVLKHASNVPGCALVLEEIFRDAGFPHDLFRTLMIPSKQVHEVIANPRIVAVTLTGSEAAGSEVAAFAGQHIKKSLLELGGSDPFIILEDADLEKAVRTAIPARMINQGQSCIAAKRFIVVEKHAHEFENRIKTALESLKPGDPLDPLTDVGPLARPDLVADLDRQVHQSVEAGARLVTGGAPLARPGCYYAPTLLADVRKGMDVYGQETFGPVIGIISVKDEKEAVAVANDSEFGLGGSVWTQDLAHGEEVARKIESGAVFVNGLVKSDPRLPFGGVKKSGYGRELSDFGIREFVNVKTIWVGM